MKRRDFIKTASLASASCFVPVFLQKEIKRPLLSSRSGKILVVIQLSGGNDGLNTVIPYRNDLYYQNRPSIAIPPNNVLPITAELGWHPAMAGLRDLYDQGLVGILNSVGYPNPDRSHFRSMDIWHTASNSDEYLAQGWLGRYLDSASCRGCDKPYHAIEVDDNLSLALKGKLRNGFAMSDARRLIKTTENRLLKAFSSLEKPAPANDQLAFLYKTLTDTQSSAQYLYQQSQKQPARSTYPATALGKDLALIAQLILAETDTKIYYASLTGFDTHANQPGRQERLLGQYAEALKAFVDDLKSNSLLDDTLILTFSEFGRRVKQNASNGTDHGAGNNVILVGGKMAQKGLLNAAPNLAQLLEGDIQHQIDFRCIYATILEKWLEAPATEILGKPFELLSFI